MYVYVHDSSWLSLMYSTIIYILHPIHICVDSNQTVLKYHRSFTSGYMYMYYRIAKNFKGFNFCR